MDDDGRRRRSARAVVRVHPRADDGLEPAIRPGSDPPVSRRGRHAAPDTGTWSVPDAGDLGDRHVGNGVVPPAEATLNGSAVNGNAVNGSAVNGSAVNGSAQASGGTPGVLDRPTFSGTYSAGWSIGLPTGRATVAPVEPGAPSPADVGPGAARHRSADDPVSKPDEPGQSVSAGSCAADDLPVPHRRRSPTRVTGRAAVVPAQPPPNPADHSPVVPAAGVAARRTVATERSRSRPSHTRPSEKRAAGSRPATASRRTRRYPVPADRPGLGYAGTHRGRRARRPLSFWQEMPLLVLVAFGLALLIKSFLLQAFFIPSGSMEDTLAIRDRVLVNKLVYDTRLPRRGEIVVFRATESWAPEAPIDQPEGFARVTRALGSAIGVAPPDEKDVIKRVIGVGGDTVSCCDVDGRVQVNGASLDEPYILENTPLQVRPFGPVDVPQGRLFVMGDHRGVSADSRVYLTDQYRGTIPVDQVVGRAFFVVWPIGRWHTLPVPETFAGVPAPGTGAAGQDGGAVAEPDERIPGDGTGTDSAPGTLIAVPVAVSAGRRRRGR